MFYRCDSLEEISLPSLTTLYAQRGLFTSCYKLRKVSMPKLVDIRNTNADNSKTMQYMFGWCPNLREVTFGLKASELLAYNGFSTYSTYSAPAANVTFHCPADAPFNVDVMYLNGKWTAVTNGTFKLCESISGTGAQYINTGYIHASNTVVEIDFALVPRPSTTRSYEALFGSRNNSDSSRSF